jgi:hypothetical protein
MAGLVDDSSRFLFFVLVMSLASYVHALFDAHAECSDAG